MRHAIFKATLVAGTLDIFSAFLFAGIAGMSVSSVLQFVASGPFGDAAKGLPSWLWAIVGLAVHFAIMACMAAAYMLAAQRIPMLVRSPLLTGLIYGLLLWVVMYWIVRPVRWPELWLPDMYSTKSMGEIVWSIGNQLFSHCILVGQPIAIIAARYCASFAAPDALRAGR
ncbi:hypothetical protein [Sphingobium aromaticiconvertens]|uniref:hypothetical protein n=1 Tax=Sphingobium aromaticiconvertens TaxID=365341 RepID=UPI003017C4A3